MFELRAVERPYPGLRAFEPHEAEIFFGREAHTDRLLGILQRERFLAVIGPSGSGKSSLVRAGLLPGLAMGSLGTGSDWRIALLRPGDRPMRSLAAALLQPEVLGRHLLSHDGEPDASDIAALEAELRRGPMALATLCAEAQRRHRADAADGAATTDFNLLVLVDQFEEIFTYADAGGQQAADESDAFVSLLLAARADAKSRPAEPGLHLALTMRTDFLGNCVRFFDLPEAINQAQYLTPRLKRDEIERAIRGPAELWGGRIEDSLVAELINATGHSADQLPLVQHALARMWREARRRQSFAPWIDWDVARTIGGVGGAIESHARELWDQLTLGERAIAVGLFTAITEWRSGDSGGQKVRRPQALASIGSWLDRPIAEIAGVVRHYAAPDVCFLQYGAVLDDTSIIDLAHEALIRQWPSLHIWVDIEAGRAAGYREWRRKSEEYNAGHSSLLSGSDIDRAVAWASFGAISISDSPAAFNEWRPNAAWAQRYLSDIANTGILEQLTYIRDPRKLDDLRLAAAHTDLAQTLAFITHSQDESDRIRADQALQIERDRDYQRQLAEAAQTKALRAKRQTVFFAAFGVIALALAILASWSWQRAMDSATDANRLRLVAEAATTDAKRQAIWAETSTSAAKAARLDAENAASREAVAALAADQARRKAEAEEMNARGAQVAAELSQAGLKRALFKATQQRMVADANAIYNRRKVGGDLDAIRLALAAVRVSGTPEAWGELQIPANEHNEVKIIGSRSRGWAIAWSPDGTRIASNSLDNTLRIWDAQTGYPIGQILKGHASEVTSVAFSPDGTRIATGSGDYTLRLWDAVSGQSVGQPLKGHTGAVNSLAFDPDGSRIVSGSADKTLRLWDSRTGAPIGQPIKGADAVFSVAFSPDGGRIAAGSGGSGGGALARYYETPSEIRLWDSRTGKLIGKPLIGHKGLVWSVAFSPDGARIVSGSGDRTLRIWDANTGEPIGKPLIGHTGWVRCVAFSPDGSLIVSGGEDNRLRLWDVRTGEPIGEPLKGHTDFVLSVAFSPDGSRIVSGGEDNTLRIWDARRDDSIARTFKGHTGGVLSVAFSPGGGRIISGSEDKTLIMWDARSGDAIGPPLYWHTGSVTSVAFSPNATRIASGSDDTAIQLWDARTGKPIQTFNGHTDIISSVAFSSDGSRIVSGSKDGTVRIWNTLTGRTVGLPLKGHADRVTSVAVSPDGSRIVSASFDETLRLWDAHSGEPVGVFLAGHSDLVWGVAFSPDGRRLVSGSRDHTLRLWDVEKTKPIGHPMKGHTGIVNSVAYSPDGNHIVSGSDDKTLRYWDSRTGEPIGQPLIGHKNSVNSVAYSPEGGLVVSGSGEWRGYDNTVRVWLSPSGWAEKLCKLLTRNYSPEEWDHYVGKEIDYTVQCPSLPVPLRGEFPLDEKGSR